jgi:hypothetical protein
MERAADEITDKTRANFCEWFQPVPLKCQATGQTDRSALDSLFGDTPGTEGAPASARRALDDLFG